MITVWGGQTSRSIRVVWLLEEMGLPYRVAQVDMLAPQQDPAFLAINPANYIPALQDGEVVMVESIAIMEYLMARYGPTPLAPPATDAAFPAYQQFLHLGEAGLATLMMPVVVSRFIAPEAERENWGARWCLQSFQKRLGLVEARLSRSPYLAGEAFTAADISVTYALNLGHRNCGLTLTDAQQAYLARTTGREAYERAMERSHEGVGG
ncbi:glutathione S-transferase family protein [Phenylobacterium sp.]|uniref:glutathione S-transferase family protein n=1 Tax=Phenylobacterium sp. TaxID=1871053 RepID=UPI0019A2BC74|nr:glutathione S-transferase family protein [Phenylobacterium sp.]MBC7169274.1 glutathione S-transferase family protein [Phenylobacterium sp.]